MGAVRRTLRILLIGTTVLSAVLCMTTVALWVRSHVTRDVWSKNDGQTVRSVDLNAGWMSVGCLQVNPGAPAWSWRHDVMGAHDRPSTKWERILGVGTEDNVG